MPAIGITGGISTGKTTFCDCLRQILPAARFFSADQAARQLVDLDPAVKNEITAEFGADIYSAAGDLNRSRLRVIILQSTAKKHALEQILHPRIRRQWSAEAQTHLNSSDFFFADIPLLYETGGETLCNRVVVVACSPSIQLERLLARGSVEGRAPASLAPASREFAPRRRLRAGGRPPLDERTAHEMINSQMPLEEKIFLADHVVWNNAGRSMLTEQAKFLVDRWHEESWTKS
jgi:dephospho-CoA kinase